MMIGTKGRKRAVTWLLAVALILVLGGAALLYSRLSAGANLSGRRAGDAGKTDGFRQQ